MIKKTQNKTFIIILFFGLLFVSYANFCLAQLEVSYPTLPSGATVVSGIDIPHYVRYLFDFGMGAGFFAVFFSLVLAGAMYLLSPAFSNAEFLSRAKDRVAGAISGLLILLTLYLIITTIYPPLSFFYFEKIPPAPPEEPKPKEPGVYLNKSNNCSNNEKPITASIKDLGRELTNQINSVNIEHDKENSISYISVLYDGPNFIGKCQYINPKTNCTSVSPFAASASVYQYDFSPNGNGVYLFRKSFFNGAGGYYKVPNSDIKGIYMQSLEKLSFKDPSAKTRENPDGCTVPKEEQDCVLFDKNGICQKRQCPNLSGENITSIGIDGNYFVLLIYFNPMTDRPSGPWTMCQAFPGVDDTAKNGPKQIKWENIRNSNKGAIPNYLIIIPVAQK